MFLLYSMIGMDLLSCLYPDICFALGLTGHICFPQDMKKKILKRTKSFGGSFSNPHVAYEAFMCLADDVKRSTTGRQPKVFVI